MFTQILDTSQAKIVLLDTHPEAKKSDPTVIFLHGHCTHKGFFSSQMSSPHLAGMRLIALDLPGYGESSPPKDSQKTYSFPGFASVVQEVVTLLGLENIVIVGWSLGGHVAMELTQLCTQLRGILITGAPPIEISEKGLSLGFRIEDPKLLACFGKGHLSKEEAELFATISGYDYSKDKWFIVEAILKTDEGVKTIYPQSILKGIGKNEVEIVATWPHPIAVIAGAEDKGINNHYIQNNVKFKNLWKNRVHIIERAGHAVHMERSEEFNLLLQQFLQDIFTISRRI